MEIALISSTARRYGRSPSTTRLDRWDAQVFGVVPLAEVGSRWRRYVAQSGRVGVPVYSWVPRVNSGGAFRPSRGNQRMTSRGGVAIRPSPMLKPCHLT